MNIQNLVGSDGRIFSNQLASSVYVPFVLQNDMMIKLSHFNVQYTTETAQIDLCYNLYCPKYKLTIIVLSSS